MARLHLPFQLVPLRLRRSASPSHELHKAQIQGCSSAGGPEQKYFHSVASVSFLGKQGS